MAQTKLGENTVNTNGNLPAIGSTAPDFTLTGIDLKELSLKDFAGKKIVLNIFPSIDTGVCATSVREFNKRAASLTDTVVLCISKDLLVSASLPARTVCKRDLCLVMVTVFRLPLQLNQNYIN